MAIFTNLVPYHIKRNILHQVNPAYSLSKSFNDYADMFLYQCAKYILFNQKQSLDGIDIIDGFFNEHMSHEFFLTCDTTTKLSSQQVDTFILSIKEYFNKTITKDAAMLLFDGLQYIFAELCEASIKVVTRRLVLIQFIADYQQRFTYNDIINNGDDDDTNDVSYDYFTLNQDDLVSGILTDIELFSLHQTLQETNAIILLPRHDYSLETILIPTEVKLQLLACSQNKALPKDVEEFIDMIMYCCTHHILRNATNSVFDVQDIIHSFYNDDYPNLSDMTRYYATKSIRKQFSVFYSDSFAEKVRQSFAFYITKDALLYLAGCLEFMFGFICEAIEDDHNTNTHGVSCNDILVALNQYPELVTFLNDACISPVLKK